MNWLMKARSTLAEMLHPGQRLSILTNRLPASKFDYQTSLGDGLGSNLIMAPFFWLARTFPEAYLTISDITKEDQCETGYESHSFLKLVQRPNPGYTGISLWMGTLASWILDGNSYWMKIRNPKTWEVVQLWYVPHWMMTPAWPFDGKTFISHYIYSPAGKEKQEIPCEDVIHFRHGIDPRNTRKGLSPIWSVLREIFTDEEAANFTASVLKNMGVPGVVISPADNSQTITDSQAKSLKEYLTLQFTGDSRGAPLVMKGSTKVEQFGWSPKDMTLGDLRNIPEERICAILGIPAAVVGFGTGLEQTKVGATMREMIALAWKQCVIPTQRLFAEQLQISLLSEFEADPDRFKVWFDTSDVEALQESENQRAERMLKLVNGGLITMGEGRSDLGFDVNSSHDIYLRPSSLIEVPASMLGKMPPEPPPEPPPAEEEAEESENEPVSDVQTDQDEETEKALAKRLKILGTARQGRPTQMHRNLLAAFERDRKKMEKTFGVNTKLFFARLGKIANEAAEEILKETTGEIKRTLEDAVDESFDEMWEHNARLDADKIMLKMPWAKLKNEWVVLGRRQYLGIAQTTFKTVSNVMGLEIGMPDVVAEKIFAAGGRRLGLIDIASQTKDRIFRELMEGRANGESAASLAKRILDMVPAGPWSTPQIRSAVIGRTETMHAQRTSALSAYRESGVVNEVMVFDGRLPTSDEDCTNRDQSIVSFEDGETMVEEEHPNGTLSLVPWMETQQR